jgi:hypothetical protein
METSERKSLSIVLIQKGVALLQQSGIETKEFFFLVPLQRCAV